MTVAILSAAKGFSRLSDREIRFLVVALVALFTGFVSQNGLPGSVVALGVGALILTQCGQAWTRARLAAAGVNLVALLAVATQPGPLNLTVMWLSLAGFALVQHGPSNAFALAKAALLNLGNAPFAAFRDLHVIRKLRRRRQIHPRLMTVANLLLPLLAIAIFGMLLMTANPLIEATVTRLSWGDSLDFLASWMPLVTVLMFFLGRAVLEMKAPHARPIGDTALWQPQYFMPGPVAVTLLALNGMFMAENILDLNYVWSDAALPAGMSHAEYVHRGAYALIATAILAGALMILALQPGSRAEASKAVRWLVYLWTAQNVLLVASSVKRTFSYIDAYGMTLWRLSGLIWMGLVAAGLIFIMARVIARRGPGWLVNINLGTAFAVLLICGLIDFRAVVADWNVERALARIGPVNVNQPIDLDRHYLDNLGPSAIAPLERLVAVAASAGSIWTPNHVITRDVPTQIRQLCHRLGNEQSDWKTWTLRGYAQLRNSSCQ